MVRISPLTLSIFRQHHQKGVQERLRLPQRAEDWFFEVPTCASEIYDAFLADRDEITGYDPRQFTDFESAVGRAVLNHGSSCEPTWCLAPVMS